MVRFLLHLAAVVLFVVAFVFGTESLHGYTVDELDWVAAGLACWCASALAPPPRASA